MYNDQEEKYPIPSRATKGKQKAKKRFPVLLIVFIAVVGMFIGAKALIGGEDKTVEQQVLPTKTSIVESEPMPKAEEPVKTDTTPIKENEQTNSKEEVKNEELEQQVNLEPIGTAQTEPHITTFEKESLDWQEMTAALQLATNLTDEEMIIWRLGNGGAPDLALGIVSTSATKSTPTQVRLKWIENQGWMPTDIEVLDSNEYLTE